MIFHIKHFDTTLITFEYLDLGIKGQTCRIIHINNKQKHLLPIGFKICDEGVMSWLRKRIIPKNREFVDTLLARMGLSHNDTIAIINVCKGLSINDCYWVVEDDFNGLFSEYNLYENKFEKTLSLIAYTGYGSAKAQGFTSSPEFTTNGMLKKAWRIKHGIVTLYKGGTYGGANTGNEPYSEYYAAQVASAMEIEHIDYNLAKWKKSLCSTCELFTSLNESYVPIYNYVEKMPIGEVAEFLKKMGTQYYDAFADMIIFDCVICNQDRHYGNFGILVDSHSNRPLKLAPVFDNGLSLFNYAMADDLKNVHDYANTRLSFYGISFQELAKEFLDDRQRGKLRKLVDFKFKKHSSYNLPAKRLKIIECFIQDRARELLEM